MSLGALFQARFDTTAFSLAAATMVIGKMLFVVLIQTGLFSMGGASC